MVARCNVRPACGLGGCDRSTSFSFLRPSGVHSNTQASTSDGTKPIASTVASDSRRALTRSQSPLREGRGATSQIWFRDFCIWANTVVAPATMATTPTTVGQMPLSSIREFNTAVCTTWAASLPRTCSS